MGDCYRPIRDYAVIGDGRTIALVAIDGSLDWLCLPDLDSPSVFAALLDAPGGGCFELCPEGPSQTTRRYRRATNVLETTFTAPTGVVRITDAMTLPGPALGPFREVARRVDGLAGRVAMRWRVAPRFGYAAARARIEPRAPFPVITSGASALAVCAWDAGVPTCGLDAVSGRFEIREGNAGLLALAIAHQEPLVLPARRDVEARLDATAAFWQGWAAGLRYTGRWQDAVIRSALALKLLVYAPSGAIAAAATTSLPEQIGGERNWDYRFCWIRDSSFTLESFLQLGCHAEATAFFWWLMHAARLTMPRLQVLYRLDGGADASERTLPLEGYRRSRPVRIGNDAASQLQLDTFGNLLDTALVYANGGYRLGADIAADLARVADFVCERWPDPDAGIWEVRAAPRHHTHSKAMCWVALDRAVRLADGGHLPGRHAARWRREAQRIREFIEQRCWSPTKGTYVAFEGSDAVDASLLLLIIMRYDDPASPRLRSTVDAVRRELGRGPLLYRYRTADGIAGDEGVFLCCSFWLAEALAITGQPEEATRLMDELVGLANDVGLYAEELEPGSGEFLGNFPQGLVHLALVSAAIAIEGARR